MGGSKNDSAGRWLTNLIGLTGLIALVISTLAWTAGAAPTVTITTAPPTRAGSVSLKFFKCADANCTHGVNAECTIPIPAGITAAQKAALIQDVLDNPVATPVPPGGCGLTVVRGGNVLTVTNPPNGVECTKATDSTGEVMQVANDTTGLPVNYVSSFKLSGVPQSGSVTIGQNGISHSVPTTVGEPIVDVYASLALAFGEGSTGPNGFSLPGQSGTLRSFNFEVIDPGLTIEVNQSGFSTPSVPTASTWLLVALVLVSVGVATIVSRRRARANTV